MPEPELPPGAVVYLPLVSFSQEAWRLGLWGAGRGEKGYAQMGILVGLIAFAGMAGAVVGTGGIPAHRPIAHPPRNMLAPFSNKAFTWLWLGFIVQMVSVSICTAMLPFYDKYWLGNKESTIPASSQVWLCSRLLLLGAGLYCRGV